MTPPDLPRPARNYEAERRRRHQAAGTLVTIAALVTFAAVTWPPAILLVLAATGAAYTWDHRG